MRRLTINIGTLPPDEFHSDVEAALREQHEIESHECQLWFVSLESLATALKIDLETVRRVLLPTRKLGPDAHLLTPATEANPRSAGLGSFLDDWEARHGKITSEELAREAYVVSYEQDNGPIYPPLTAEFGAVSEDANITPISQSSVNPQSDHQHLDRSLALHCLVARKLLADPTLIVQARGTLARWKEQTKDPVPVYILEWQRILEGSPEEIAAFIASMRDDATRLWQSSPFTGVLTLQERSRIYNAFR